MNAEQSIERAMKAARPRGANEIAMDAALSVPLGTRHETPANVVTLPISPEAVAAIRAAVTFVPDPI